MGGGLKVPLLFLFVKTIEKTKSNKIKHCVGLFFSSGGCEDRAILWAFFTNLSIESIYLLNYVKNGLIFKTANQIIFFQHNA